MEDIIRKAGLDRDRADAIMTMVAQGNVDITKSVPDPEGDADGVDKLAKAIAKA